MIQLVCPHCQADLGAPDDLSGQEILCNSCLRLVPAGLSTTWARTEVPSAIEATRSESENAESESLLRCLRPALQPDELGRLGDYRVLKILGQGGMGIVFLAEDPGLRRRVALKVIRPQLADEKTRKRFLREAQAAASVEHENVISIYGMGEEQGVPYLAMKYLAGETLDNRLDREKSLYIPEILRIGREIAAGLSAAHSKGLIHRDVKPSNIWLEPPNASVRLLDFGLARAIQVDVEVTPSGAVLGTPAYMAPEQAKGETIDHRADLFNLGCVLYKMSTGKRPFTGNSQMAVLLALATDTPTQGRKVNPSIPPELSALIDELLQKDRNKRPGTAQEVVERLARLEGDPARRAKKSGWVWFGLAIAGLLVLGGAILIANALKEKREPIDPTPKIEPPTKIVPEPAKKESPPIVAIALNPVGGPAEYRTIIETQSTKGTLILNYEMFMVPDQLTVYYDGVKIYDSGLVSNKGTLSLNYGPGKSTTLEIVMNEGKVHPGTVWELNGRVVPGHHLAPDKLGVPDKKQPSKGLRKKD